MADTWMLVSSSDPFSFKMVGSAEFEPGFFKGQPGSFILRVGEQELNLDEATDTLYACRKVVGGGAVVWMVYIKKQGWIFCNNPLNQLLEEG